MNKIKGCNNNVSSTVDGINDPIGIVNLFADKFSSIYNSSQNDENGNMLDSVVKQVHENVVNSCCNHNESISHMHVVTVDQIMKAVHLMKANKRDGTCDISNPITRGKHKLFVLISLLST